MLTRIITAAVALAVFIAVLMLPPVVFSLALAAVIFMMLFECYTATKADAKLKTVGFICGALVMAMYYIAVTFGSAPVVLALPFAVILLYMTTVVIKHGKCDYKEVLANGFLTIYITACAGCIWLTKEFFGISGMLLIFICAWGCDTFAYFSGRFWGKHKLIPKVSPKKTVEGAIGGIVGSALLCAVYLVISGQWGNTEAVNSTLIITGIAVGIAGGALSQLGDLTASAIKRDGGIKDFGKIFPGHGGFMDRFDSVIFIAPVVLGILFLFK